MPNLRKMIDGLGGLWLGLTSPAPVKAAYKVRDQVVIRRAVTRSGPRTQEVIVATITALGEDGKSAVVTIPRAGGVITRATVELDQVEPVSAAFKQSSVNWNPAFRGSV